MASTTTCTTRGTPRTTISIRHSCQHGALFIRSFYRYARPTTKISCSQHFSLDLLRNDFKPSFTELGSLAKSIYYVQHCVRKQKSQSAVKSHKISKSTKKEMERALSRHAKHTHRWGIGSPVLFQNILHTFKGVEAPWHNSSASLELSTDPTQQ